MAERTVVAEYMVWQDAMSQFWLIGRLFAPVDQLSAKPDPDRMSQNYQHRVVMSSSRGLARFLPP